MGDKDDPNLTIGPRVARSARPTPRATRVAERHLNAQRDQVEQKAQNPVVAMLFGMVRLAQVPFVVVWVWSKLLEPGIKSHDLWQVGFGVVAALGSLWVAAPQRTVDGVRMLIALLGDFAAALARVVAARGGRSAPSNDPPVNDR